MRAAPRWQFVVGLLAALALVATGLGHALPHAAPATAGASVTGQTGQTGQTAPAPGQPSMEAPVSDLVVRGAPLAVVPAPTGPAAGLLPVGGPPVAPHLVAQPQARPPTVSVAATVAGAPGSRAPPGTTGT